MTYHKNLNSLFKHLTNNVIPDVMDNEVLRVVKQVQSRKVQDVVYKAYEPFVYDRRGWTGGLADQNNIVGNLSFGVNQVTLTVNNITKGKNQNIYTAPLVEGGHGYRNLEYQYTKNREDTQGKYLRPRPFISETVRQLEATLAHVDAMRRGLKRHGIRTI